MESVEAVSDGIYYIVLADLAGSTHFGAHMGNAALAARIESFAEASKRALANAKKSSNTGQFLKTVGDGVLLVFSHFPDIIQWDMEFEGALHQVRSRDIPIEKRVCVHAGEVRFRSGDTMALAVNQVFKLEKSVQVGSFVVSDIAYQLAAPSLYPKQCVFKEYDTIMLPGYIQPVKLHRLVIKADILFLIDKTSGQNPFLEP